MRPPQRPGHLHTCRTCGSETVKGAELCDECTLVQHQRRASNLKPFFQTRQTHYGRLVTKKRPMWIWPPGFDEKYRYGFITCHVKSGEPHPRGVD